MRIVKSGIKNAKHIAKPMQSECGKRVVGEKGKASGVVRIVQESGGRRRRNRSGDGESWLPSKKDWLQSKGSSTIEDSKRHNAANYMLTPGSLHGGG